MAHGVTQIGESCSLVIRRDSTRQNMGAVCWVAGFMRTISVWIEVFDANKINMEYWTIFDLLNKEYQGPDSEIIIMNIRPQRCARR
jgi:hypothetical protein